MTSDTIVDESPLRRLWWTDGFLWYEVAMTSIILVLNIAAILYMTMRTPKIPLDESVLGPVLWCTIWSVVAGTTSFICWVVLEDEDGRPRWTYCVGPLGHTFSFCLFLCLVYSISPRLALHVGLPFLLWFVPATIAPCFSQRGYPDW